jgi:membrane protein
LAAFLPTVLSISVFTVMFAAIPNRQIPISDALTGGTVGGLLFAVLRWGFGYYITSSGAYTSVYGAVAAVPIVLFWMFLSWVVVLVGAEITASLSEWRAGFAQHAKAATGERRLALALQVMALLHQASQQGSGGVGRRTLLTETTGSEAELTGILRKLHAAGFSAPTNKGRILLARDLGTVSLNDLIKVLDLGLGLDDRVASAAPWRERVTPLLALAHDGMKSALDVTLADVFAA